MTKYDAIVIGSGIGGLGTAAMLARHGKKVLVLERHYVAGGLTHTFRRRQFEWDVGVHYLGQVHDPEHPLRRAFDYVTGGKLAWAPMDPVYDRMIFDDARFEFRTGVETLKDDLSRAFPSEARAIGSYFDTVRRAARSADKFFLQRIVPKWLGWLLHPVLGRPFQRYAGRTTLSMLRSWTRNERLIGVLTGQWGNYGLPPERSSFGMHALVADYYLEGASYPVGGASRLASTIMPVIEAVGGDVWTSTPVANILVRDGKAIGVRTEAGLEVFAPCIVSNAGVETTLNQLLPVSPRAERSACPPPSTGHIALYLGLSGTASELGLGSSNLWVHAGYDHDATTRAFERNPQAPFPLVYINSPSAKDPDWERRHPGISTVVAIVPASFAPFARWSGTRWAKRGREYIDYKAWLTERLLAIVCRELPGVKGRILHQELSTPLSTVHFTGHAAGAMYGFEHSPQRFHTRWLRSASPVPGLFFVGQDVVTVGVGASLMSGVLASSVILRRNVLGDVLRGGST
ncbi:NAD(P)/FAD-dependent oxidoreductase [Pendulispora rubella]|uniref:NAD(P)/FAD-dependent oxidoreductase n=1 Tax=Pendulispora rubella TaxID=2741070 RepID=A0ABZ2LGX2_9BACT